MIAADGVESRIARWAGIDTSLGLQDLGVCVQYYMTDIELDPGCIEFYFGSRWAPGGYAWVFPKGEREANVGLGTCIQRPEPATDDRLPRRVHSLEVP